MRKLGNVSRTTLFLILCMVLCAFGCQSSQLVHSDSNKQQPISEPTSAPTAAVTPEPTPEPTVTPYAPEIITVRFVGDIMVSKPMILSAEQPDGSYRFDDIYTEIAKELRGADLMIGNLETPIAGVENDGFTGNPRFNAPDEFLTAIHDSGFNVLTNANNHLLDRGVDGAIDTIQKIRKLGMLQTGAFISAEDAQQLLITEIRGVKICILAYSYHSTRTERPQDRVALQWLRNYNEPDKMKEDIKKAREQGADVVIVFTHMGTEGSYEPNRLQRDMAKHLVNCGVDAAIFCHTHAVQPLERLTAPDGREIPVAYSLGNFLADGKYRMSRSGMILELSVTVDRQACTVNVDHVRYVPSYSHQEERDGFMYFKLYAAGVAMNDPNLSPETRSLAKISWDTVTKTVGEDYAQATRSFSDSCSVLERLG
ncbi:MAG: CapA family protein [Clostridia bacterium]